MNPEKLKRLQAQVRIGGKGSQRRKKKVVHKGPGENSKRINQELQRLGLQKLNEITSSTIEMNDGSAILFTKAEILGGNSNVFAIIGKEVQNKSADEMNAVRQAFGGGLGGGGAPAGGDDSDDDIPQLVEGTDFQAGADGAADDGSDDEMPELTEA